jgi:hypothetical protein
VKERRARGRRWCQQNVNPPAPAPSTPTATAPAPSIAAAAAAAATATAIKDVRKVLRDEAAHALRALEVPRHDVAPQLEIESKV